MNVEVERLFTHTALFDTYSTYTLYMAPRHATHDTDHSARTRDHIIVDTVFDRCRVWGVAWAVG